MFTGNVRRRVARVSLLALGGSAGCGGVRLAHPSTVQAMSVQSTQSPSLSTATFHDESVSALQVTSDEASAALERPLFVIDGVPLADDYTVKIDVPKIARIDVLTDSLVTHAYGVRGARTVVLVTLRSR